MISFGVLGPFRAEDENGPLDVKGPRHRAVLARLVIARGQVVPVERLVDDLWAGAAPEAAVGAVQTFVSALRRALEPHRAPRTPARLLVTTAPGYALRAEPEAVDAWRFESALTTALASAPGGPAVDETALTLVEDALALWRGPAYADFADQAWAQAEIARLDELRLLASEHRARIQVELGRAAQAVPELEAQVAAHPLREDGWQLLALALYRSGRQGDALGALRRARQILEQELGVDPGPLLRRLEADILAQADALTAPPAPAAPPGGPRAPGQTPGQTPGQAPEDVLVGRAEELAQLTQVAATTASGGLGLVLVSGDAGAGKTALAKAFTGQLTRQGWTAAWGSNPEHDGVPATWLWSQLLDTLGTGGLAPALPSPALPSPALPPALSSPAPGSQIAARLQWHRAVGVFLLQVARRSPLLLVLDDLHWAGAETLALLTSVITDLRAAAGSSSVLVVLTYRTTDLSPDLTDFLARTARAEPTRIYLGGLPADAVPELVRATVGRLVEPDQARTIHRRSGGNPFFIRELARLLAAEGPDGLDRVPPGVRDVVRHRLGRLPPPAQAVLQQAAVIGTDLDLAVLAALIQDEDQLLDAVEAASERGFLTETGPQRFRFAHALVRDTLYQDLSRSRRARRHAAVAAALLEVRPDDVEALAHHFRLAEDPALAPQTVRYSRAAAERAERRFAPHEATQLWQAALTAAEQSSDDPSDRLDLIMGLVRALAVTGSLGQARQYRAQALTLAENLSPDPIRIAQVIGAFDVPALWTDTDDPALASRIATVTERTLAALPPQCLAERSRLLATLAVELRSSGGERGRAAALEAETLARSLDDPALLGFALNARFLQSFERSGLAAQRAVIGSEILALAQAEELVTFEVLGQLILVQARAALADLEAADRHASAADELAARHRIPLVGVFTHGYRALRAAIRNEPDPGYRATAARLTGSGMSGLADGLLPLTLLVHHLQLDHPLPFDHPLPLDRHGPVLRTLPAELLEASFGGYEPWCRPFLLLAAGQTEQARAAVAQIPPSPRDLLLEARTALHAVLAVAFDDQVIMKQLSTELHSAADELAGAGSGLLTLRPVAFYLGDLALGLGRPEQAAQYYAQAVVVADRCGARHWATAAQAAAERITRPSGRLRPS